MSKKSLEYLPLYQRRMTPNQFGMAQALYLNKRLPSLNSINNGTLRTMNLRGFVVIYNEVPVLTAAGIEAVETYRDGKCPLRKDAKELTDFVQQMLKLSLKRKRAS